MSLADSSKSERIEEFLRKSLLGEELVNTQFHLFSAKSVSSGRLTKPRVLCANNVLLTKSSGYFLDLLSSDANPPGGSLIDLASADDVPRHIQIEDYGYGSDSDLDDDDDGDEHDPGVAGNEAVNDKSVAAPPVSADRPQISLLTQPKDDDESSEDGSESVSSDVFVMSPEHPTTDGPFDGFNLAEAASVMSGQTAVQKSPAAGDKAPTGLRSSGSRHMLVRDAAFRTWYALLNCLYTDKVDFRPLGSAIPEGQPRKSSASSLDEARCSAKSMYRLACKVGLDHLRDEALAHVRSNLTEHNVLKELSCSIVTSHPQLLEMELDALYAHIGSASVVQDFPAFAQRIAHGELPHGAEVIVGIHSRLLKEDQASSPRSISPVPPLSLPTSASLAPLRPFEEVLPPQFLPTETLAISEPPPNTVAETPIGTPAFVGSVFRMSNPTDVSPDFESEEVMAGKKGNATKRGGFGKKKKQVKSDSVARHADGDASVQ